MASSVRTISVLSFTAPAAEVSAPTSSGVIDWRIRIIRWGDIRCDLLKFSDGYIRRRSY